ncbi:MAG: hypothetical protein KGJ60_16025, partial [Verrucomicrobiota bacterium]|nr:hypothetical protein [Verrucomicrobiota bacterium]
IQFADVLPGVGIFAVALVWRTIRRLRARRRDRLTFSPLSRDELRKARSKLRKGKSVEKV